MMEIEVTPKGTNLRLHRHNFYSAPSIFTEKDYADQQSQLRFQVKTHGATNLWADAMLRYLWGGCFRGPVRYPWTLLQPLFSLYFLF